MDEALDLMALGAFSEHVSLENVRLRELEGVREGLTHMRLRGEMQDSVDRMVA
jgi:hypothetical protein